MEKEGEEMSTGREKGSGYRKKWMLEYMKKRKKKKQDESG